MREATSNPDLREALPEMLRRTRGARWQVVGFFQALLFGLQTGLGYASRLPELRRSYVRYLLVVGLLISSQMGLLLLLVPWHLAVLPIATTTLWFLAGAVVVLALLSLIRRQDGELARTFGLSNGLTLYRFMSIPLLASLMPLFHDYRPVLALGTVAFLAAAITDVLDGNIARITGTVTDFGRIYDPLCDIAINAAVCIGGWTAGYLPGWYLVLALSRFFLPVVGGAIVYASGHPWRVRPTLLGKLSVFVYVLFIGLTLIREFTQAPFLSNLVDQFLFISGLLFFFNVIYIVDRGWSLMREKQAN
jgi:cardiolipin synthase